MAVFILVVVFPDSIMAMNMSVSMKAVAVFVSLMVEDECTEYVDEKTYAGYKKSIVIIYLLRMEQSFCRHPQNKNAHKPKEDGTCICSKYLYLPRPECIAFVVSMLPRNHISKKRYQECNRMRTHMPAIGKESR